MPKVARKTTETLNRPACLVRLYHLWQAERDQGHELPPDEQGIEPHTLPDADLVALGKRVAARVNARQQQAATTATPGQGGKLPAAPYRVQQVTFLEETIPTLYRVVLPDGTGLPWADDILLAHASYSTWLDKQGAPVPELPPDSGVSAPRGSSLLDDMARARVQGLRNAGLLAFGEGNAGGFFYYANLEGPFESEDAAQQWAADDPTRIKVLELSSPGDLVIREGNGGYYYDAIVAVPFESEDAAEQWAAGARACPQAAPDTERDAPVPHSDEKGNGMWGRHADERLQLLLRLAALQREQGVPVLSPLELGNVSNEEIAQRIAALEGQGERDEGAVQQQVQQQVMEGQGERDESAVQQQVMEGLV